MALLPDDVRALLANRIARVHDRIVTGPRVNIPDGYVLVERDGLDQLIADQIEDEDDEPLDPDAMRAANDAATMALNHDVTPLVNHVRTVRHQLMSTENGQDGFSEEAAEHMSMAVWHALLGISIEDE